MHQFHAERARSEPTRAQVVSLVQDALYCEGTDAYRPMNWPREDAPEVDTKAEIQWAVGVVRRLWPELDDESLAEFATMGLAS